MNPFHLALSARLSLTLVGVGLPFARRERFPLIPT